MTLSMMLGIFSILIFVAGIIIATTFIILNKILIPYKEKTTHTECLVSLDILNAVVGAELTIFNNDILGNRSTITNANYENYLKDLTERIYNSLSESFLDDISYYLTREAVIRLITRQVKNFLLSKIHGSAE